LELRNVGFRYGGRTVLDNLNLTIRPGEMVGLVGASGAGKSTLVNLVCRFYDVGDGAILADGTDLRSFPVREYRRNIGIVLQEPFLFYGTVAENIAYGTAAAEAEIVAAAKAAAAHGFVSELPDGYDTQLGPQGVGLSGGQRQRIGIARTLLRNPPVLVLDEPTTGLDIGAQDHVLEGLRELMRDRTTILITHQRELWETADDVLHIADGRIVEASEQPAKRLTAVG